MNFIEGNQIILLITQVIIGMIVYIGTSYILQLEPFVYIVNVFSGMTEDKRVKYILNKFLIKKVV